MKIRWKKFSDLNDTNLPKSINSKHWKSEEDFDYEKAAAI